MTHMEFFPERLENSNNDVSFKGKVSGEESISGYFEFHSHNELFHKGKMTLLRKNSNVKFVYTTLIEASHVSSIMGNLSSTPYLSSRGEIGTYLCKKILQPDGKVAY